MQDTTKLLAQTLKLEEVLQYLCIHMSYTYYIHVQITHTCSCIISYIHSHLCWPLNPKPAWWAILTKYL